MEAKNVDREELLAFEHKILAAIDKVEANLGSKVDQLTLELKALNKVTTEQDKELALVKQEVAGVKNQVEEIESRTNKNSDKILINETKQEANVNQLKWWMGVIGFIVTVLTFILKYWPL